MLRHPHCFLPGVSIAVCLQSGHHGTAELARGRKRAMRERKTGFHEISFILQPSILLFTSYSACRRFVSFFFLVWFAVGSCSEMPKQSPRPRTRFPEPLLSLHHLRETLGPTQSEHMPLDPVRGPRRAEGAISAGTGLLLMYTTLPHFRQHMMHADTPKQVVLI